MDYSITKTPIKSKESEKERQKVQKDENWDAQIKELIDFLRFLKNGLT
jgi:hypothetical protein